MAYTAWSVVYGEQPTAAKWNQLGTNDAGFKDGTNIDDDAILARHIADGVVDDARWRNNVTFRGYTSTNQAGIGAGVFTKMTQDLEEWDTGNNFNPTLSRFVAPYNGIYYFEGAFSVPNNDVRIFASLYKNGVEAYRATNGAYTGSANRSTGGRQMKLVAGDYIELYGWRRSAGATDASQNFAVSLSGFLVSRT